MISQLIGNKRIDLWLPAYLASVPSRLLARLARRGRLTHLVVVVCDHYEPRHGISDDNQPARRVQSWHEGYAALQERCRRELGDVPLHTFFYPPHHGLEHLPALSAMAYDGLGEVELHYHHDGDTTETLRADLVRVLADYNRWGLLLTSGDRPRPAFAFVHGDWALNNSGGGQYCGVNDELRLLQSLGCWADFTLPSGNHCQTRTINSIYYASSTPEHPKAHDHGTPARAGVTNRQGMLLVQGPLGINWRAPGYPRIENASLTTPNPGRPDRIRAWIDSNIHVQGRPDWQFIKLHTHGAIERDFDALFGEQAFAMHRELQQNFNDGRRYKLHYATARQAYNMIRAAEHGKQGDPSLWRDFELAPQPSHYYTSSSAHDLYSCSRSRLALGHIDTREPLVLRTRVAPLEQVTGALTSLDFNGETGCLLLQPVHAGAGVDLRFSVGTSIRSLTRATLVRQEEYDGGLQVSLQLQPDARVELTVQRNPPVASPVLS